MNFKSFLSLITFFAFANQIAFVKPYPKPKIISSAHASKYYENRNQIHAAALTRIKNEFKISDADWCHYMNSATNIIEKDILFANYPLDRSSISPSDHEIVKEAKEILIQCGIDPKNIEIKVDNDIECAAASQSFIPEENVIRHTLILNLDSLKLFAPEKREREAILRHEIMHLAFYDSIEEQLIIGLLQNQGYIQKAIQRSPAIINYRQQRETRADLLSVVDHPRLIEVSRAWYASLSELTEVLPTVTWDTHPSHEARAENLAQLLADVYPARLA